jgi:hypothetical protein
VIAPLSPSATRIVGHLNLFRLEAVRLELAANEIAARDLEFFARRVAGETDDLHTVAKRARNGVEHIRRGDEHDAAEVEGHGEIIVAEGVVLLRVQHLQHRGGRIALNAGPQLVDFVEHHDAVTGSGLPDALNDVAGKRADIGSPMTADLRFVVHAAEADAHKLAVHGARDRLTERRLADAGRSDKAEDRRLAVWRELAHSEIFDDPALDLVQPEVILVEDASRRADVDRRFLGKRPRQIDEPVEVGPDHAVLARGLGHALQPAQLLARLIVDLLGHPRLGDRLVEFGDLGRFSLICFAELALNRSHLLAQQDLAVAGVERGLGLATDLLREAKHLDPVRE